MPNTENRYKMSQERLDALKDELHYLETTREMEVAELIKEARSFGDLSENSEYDEAKTEQGKLYSRIAEVKNLIVENAFRNTVFRARGIFENVKYVNNYYGLWIDDTPEVFLSRCDFTRNRFALSVRAGKVLAADTKVSNNVYGLYLEEGGNYDGDISLIKDNLEADVRKENDEMSSQGKRVSRNVWQRIETGF